MTRYATRFGCYEINSLPSQVGVAICHGFEVFPQHRGKKLAKALKAHQMATLCDLGYRFAQCTVVADNIKQIRALTASGWHQMARFYSTRQGKHVEIWGCEIRPSEALHAA